MRNHVLKMHKTEVEPVQLWMTCSCGWIGPGHDIDSEAGPDILTAKMIDEARTHQIDDPIPVSADARLERVARAISPDVFLKPRINLYRDDYERAYAKARAAIAAMSDQQSA